MLTPLTALDVIKDERPDNSYCAHYQQPKGHPVTAHKLQSRKMQDACWKVDINARLILSARADWYATPVN